MTKFIPTIIEIALWLAPTALGLMILFRGRDSYEDSYNHSSAKGMGMAFSRYLLIFRIAATLLILTGLGLFYRFYIYEPTDPNSETADFWQNMEKNKADNIFQSY